MSYLFVYGTLEIPRVFEAVVSQRLPSRPAILRGYARFLLQHKVYPALFAQQGGVTTGRVYLGVRRAHLGRLDSYEDRFYIRKRVRVEMGRYRVWAWVYVLSPRYLHLISERAWDKAKFEQDHLRRFLATIGARS